MKYLLKFHKTIFIYFVLLFSLFSYFYVSNHPSDTNVNAIQHPNHQIRTKTVITLDNITNYPSNFTYSLKPSYTDRYFGSNIFELNITQTNGTSTEIKIEVGQFLNTTHSELQNFTIAKQEWLNLTGPGSSGVVNLTVFCIDVDGEVPKRTDSYKIVTTKANGKLLTLLTYIDNQSLHDFHYAQLVVWAVTDGPDQIPSGYIYDNNEVDLANALLRAAGIDDITIPYLPTFETWYLWFVIAPMGLLVLLYFIIDYVKKRRGHGRE